MKRIEKFYESFRLDRSDVRRIVEAQQNRTIKTYTLTTMSAMNARRDVNLCLWCDEIWSVDHTCNRGPNYNCRFTFGDKGEGFAFVKVSTNGLQHEEVDFLQDDAFHSSAHNLFEEVTEQRICSLKEDAVEFDAHQVFGEVSASNSELVDSNYEDPNGVLFSELEHDCTRRLLVDDVNNIQFSNSHIVLGRMSPPNFVFNQVPIKDFYNVSITSPVKPSSNLSCHECAEVSMEPIAGVERNTRCLPQCNLIRESQLPRAQQVLDKMPQPHFSDSPFVIPRLNTDNP